MSFATCSWLHEKKAPFLSCEPHFTIYRALSYLSLHLNLIDINEVKKAGIILILQMKLREIKWLIQVAQSSAEHELWFLTQRFSPYMQGPGLCSSLGLEICTAIAMHWALERLLGGGCDGGGGNRVNFALILPLYQIGVGQEQASKY